MFASEQMRYGATVLAAIFGGPGVFYAVESFGHSSYALTGVFYLGIALALTFTGQAKDVARARRPLPGRKRQP